MPERRTEARSSGEIRTQAYQEIREVMKLIAEEYYTKHPDRAMDIRGVENRDAMTKMLTDIFGVLNGYELIERRRA